MTRLLAAALFLTFTLGMNEAVAAEQMRGHVYVDANGNGVRDVREAGLAKVVVSNGRDVVQTDADGAYRIDVRPGDIVFAVKPGGYSAHRRENGLPAFWQAYQPDSPEPFKYGGLSQALSLQFDVGFQAERKRPAGPTRVLLFADPQTKSMTDVGYYRDDVVADVRRVLAARKQPVTFGTSLGDIVNDDLSLYPAMNAVTASIGLPWLHIPGNHDIDMDAREDAHALDSYRNTYGPDTFAWNERDFSFIGLDDVIWRGAPSTGYIGGFREDQLKFLRAYLATLPADRMLVLGMHIPLFEAEGKDSFRDSDRQALFNLLSRFKHVLILSAHSHTQQHVFHDAKTGWRGATPMHEYNVGAACGAFWSGVKDAQGIPAAIMADGTPNGWAMLEIQRGGQYRLDWYPARDSQQSAMHLSAPLTLRKGAYPAWGVYANAYMIAPDAKVEFNIDGGAWKPMQRVRRADPELLAENVRDDSANVLRSYDRSPEAQTVEHLWRGALATDLAVGSHVVTVRYQDINGQTQTARRTYTLRYATP